MRHYKERESSRNISPEGGIKKQEKYVYKGRWQRKTFYGNGAVVVEDLTNIIPHPVTIWKK